MLGAVVTEDGVGDVRFEDFGGPSLPLGEEGGDGFLASFEGVAAEEFGGVGRGAGAGVEEGDADFAARECLVEDGKVTDN